MENEKHGYAVAAFVFLLLYGGIFSLLVLLFGGYDSFGMGEVLALGYLLLPAVSGLFLMLRKPRIAAVLMTLVLVLTLVQEIPEILRYLEPNGYLATFDEATGYTEYIPRQFAVLPILSILAALSFAGALYLRGWPAMVLAVLAAVAELAYMVLQIMSMAYVTGHPTPLNVMFSFNYAMGAIFAGLYLFSLGGNNKTTGG